MDADEKDANVACIDRATPALSALICVHLRFPVVFVLLSYGRSSPSIRLDFSISEHDRAMGAFGDVVFVCYQ